MSGLIKAVLVVFVAILVILLGGYIYFQVTFPKVGPPEEVTIQGTEAQIERGEYLANHVAVCIDCHSQRNWDYYAGPIKPGTEGGGGEHFPLDELQGIPVNLYSKNITPYAMESWTDGEIIRAFTEGVNKDGEALFPIMPYPAYRIMSFEDRNAIVAYLRTLKPVENTVPEREVGIPFNFIMQTAPAEADPRPTPDPSDTVAYGRYLTRIASCADCHTPMEKGEPIEGMYLAGGQPFPLPSGAVSRSGNITPHVGTGIGSWSKEKFISTFKKYYKVSNRRVEVGEDGLNTIMPWIMYAGMKERDLGAIYEYLMTVDPVENKVQKFGMVSNTGQ